MSTPQEAWEIAEVALLRAVLRDEAALSGLALEPTQFARGAHQVIWRTCVHLRASGTPVTPATIGMTLASLLPDEPEKVTQVRAYVDRLHARGVDGGSDPAEVAECARVVAAYHAVRELAGALESVAALARANDIRVLHEVALLGAQAANAGRQPMAAPTWPALLDAVVADLEARQMGTVPKAPVLGFGTLDDLQVFLPGKLIILGARPGIGKSALALRLVLEATKKGHPALFISLEMAGEELAQRAFAMYARVDSLHLLRAKLQDEEWARITAAQAQMSPWPLAVMPPGEQRIEDIAARARQEKAARGLELLVIDYLQLIETPSRRNGTRQEEVDSMARAIKKLAGELACPVLALAQLGRYAGEETGTPPTLGHLRESGGQENHADSVLLLWPDLEGSSLPEWADLPVRKVHARVAKNRSGPQRLFHLTYNAPLVWFQEE